MTSSYIILDTLFFYTSADTMSLPSILKVVKGAPYFGFPLTDKLSLRIGSTVLVK